MVAQAGQSDLDAALAVALALEDDGSAPLSLKCDADTPDGVKCIHADSSAAQAAPGLVYVGVNLRGDSGWADVIGRAPDGSWHYWFGGQQFGISMVNLPQQVRVCSDGDGLNVRAAPTGDAPVVAVLADQALITVNGFVFTDVTQNPRTRDVQFGYGWYHLAGDTDGWVRSTYLATTASVGAFYGCDLHYD